MMVFGGEQDQHRPERHPFAVKLQGEAIGIESAQQYKQDPRKFIRPGVHSEDLKEDGGDPEGKMRFVEPVVSLEVKLPPVAAEEQVLGEGGVNPASGSISGIKSPLKLDANRQEDENRSQRCSRWKGIVQAGRIEAKDKNLYRFGVRPDTEPLPPQLL